jgi:hypothetical protein
MPEPKFTVNDCRAYRAGSFVSLRRIFFRLIIIGESLISEPRLTPARGNRK